ncbi:SDR family NAD(P)-dependent oxidoreductase [Dysgonomonas sp. HDW5A]|uniref:SDR family NAD(P)-dependent oxidoreductase n=1 Tax=Dysgonomonas sp. HDW5A TaxID=2714926 RepID=UPI00140A6815|nr:SDR family NAD(P)-dependent oxidoreductase [Dysgonomonas sp. HDW5A]QIK60800.1 SDR family NAD(P)-dependent oxidoreductase [Dysgonomonas sp. HDW5A]
MKKIALITGATSGIGKATAEVLAKNGFDIIITGRRKEKLLELEKLLQNEHKAEVLSLGFDVRNYADVEKYLGNLPERWKNIDVLVNNAGLAVGLNSIQEGVVDDWERMIDTNIKGLLYVTRIVSPGMIERKSGHIINIGSIASREVYANGGVYCATKHAVKALSQGMRLDMVNYGIKVTLVSPGAVETEFSVVRFKGDQSRADKVYDGFVPLRAEDVADAIYYAVSAPDHVDVQDVLLMAKAQASATVFHKE